MGRLFDAVASIIGLRDEVNYEAQAAIELEMLASKQEKGDYPFEVFPEGEELIIDPCPIIRAVIDDLNRGERRDIMAARFHNSVSSIILKICQLLREKRGLNKVALSGGVFQNMYLLERTFSLLDKAGFETYTHQHVPANDGGISLGQAVIAHYKKIKRSNFG
jgi:hydrogenase maturation protein HypF